MRIEEIARTPSRLAQRVSLFVGSRPTLVNAAKLLFAFVWGLIFGLILFS